MSWDKNAACRTPAVNREIFFPISYAGHSPEVKQAKAVCRSCPISPACLAYALERAEPEGIWAGLTPQERRTIRTRTRQEATR
ncbi:WhiB family transcriptional regulator [Streptosporangium sp. V21-05]|uniref:WhiB family transcriptional regulator n=1 Tax=Streptosporangium sp. V21-05 TaxID=3446115 RepID=UPI003F531286